jgi:putative CocE/NonD family hydrolase
MQLLEGWCDPYLRGGLDLWQQALNCGGSPELIIGPWSHLSWDRRVGSCDLGPEACGRVDQWQLAFFDQHLRGQSRPEQPSCWAYDLLSHHWKRKDPRDSLNLQWGLNSDGLAASCSDEGELKAQQSGHGQLVWVHDPWRPVPGRGGHLGLDAGLCDRADLDARADVACFTTAALQQPLELWGQFELLLSIRSDQHNFDLCGAISVLRAGQSQVLQLCTGVLRVASDNGQEPLERTLRFQPLLASLEADDRLRLSLAGSAWPQISCNPKITTLIADLSSSRLQLNAMACSAAAD